MLTCIHSARPLTCMHMLTSKQPPPPLPSSTLYVYVCICLFACMGAVFIVQVDLILGLLQPQLWAPSQQHPLRTKAPQRWARVLTPQQPACDCVYIVLVLMRCNVLLNPETGRENVVISFLKKNKMSSYPLHLVCSFVQIVEFDCNSGHVHRLVKWSPSTTKQNCQRERFLLALPPRPLLLLKITCTPFQSVCAHLRCHTLQQWVLSTETRISVDF